MKVLVLGCGPAGLLSAHAATLQGADVLVVSVKKRSTLFGCQYLHQGVPGMELGATRVHYTLRGTVEDYERKVYGITLGAGLSSSPRTLPEDHPGWDIRRAYDLLWSRYEAAIQDQQIYAETFDSIIRYYAPDLVVSSVPLPTLCYRPDIHSFSSRNCWAIGDAPERGQSVPVPCPEDTVICDGRPEVGYYRVSRVFGYSTAEWSSVGPRPPLSGVVSFRKPLATTCDCWRAEVGRPVVLRVGRHGRWKKGVLAHHAFNDTTEAVASFLEAGV